MAGATDAVSQLLRMAGAPDAVSQLIRMAGAPDGGGGAEDGSPEESREHHLLRGAACQHTNICLMSTRKGLTGEPRSYETATP